MIQTIHCEKTLENGRKTGVMVACGEKLATASGSSV